MSLERRAEHGPRLLFLSGGTALRGLSRELIHHTHNSVHIITTLDSGGSSAVLRKAFNMPAVGDIRNRLMALADLSVPGTKEIFSLFTYRLSKKEPQIALRMELERLVNGEHLLVGLIPEPKRSVIGETLETFLKLMPEDFDLRGASIGNLILTGEYLTHGRKLAPVIDRFARLAGVRGTVRPIVDADLHMAAELKNGTVVTGQHRLTGKETAPIASKISRTWLTDNVNSADRITASLDDEAQQLLKEADLICYPIGSFYSSVVANLLVDGVGKAIAANPCPKVFVPNTLGDPELLDHTVMEQVRILGNYLMESGAPDRSSGLNTVLVDSRADYPGGLDIPAMNSMGVKVVDVPLVTVDSAPLFHPRLLTDALLSFTE